jgi:hypothetical protein
MTKRVIVPHFAPLRRIVATEITDPAERTALLEASRRAHPERSGRKTASGNGKKARKKPIVNKADKRSGPQGPRTAS